MLYSLGVQMMMCDILTQRLSGHLPSYILKYIALYFADYTQTLIYYVSVQVIENVCKFKIVIFHNYTLVQAYKWPIVMAVEIFCVIFLPHHLLEVKNISTSYI